MADKLREARRRRIIENSEKRLQKIMNLTQNQGNNCDSQLIAEQVQARACDFPARPAVVEHVNTEPESYIRQRFRDDNFVPTSGPSDEMVVPQQESLLGGLLTQDPIPVKQTDYFSLALCILAVTSIALLHSGFGMLICNNICLPFMLLEAWIIFTRSRESSVGPGGLLNAALVLCGLDPVQIKKASQIMSNLTGITGDLSVYLFVSILSYQVFRMYE